MLCIFVDKFVTPAYIDLNIIHRRIWVTVILILWMNPAVLMRAVHCFESPVISYSISDYI